MAYRFGQAKTGADTLTEGMSEILKNMLAKKQYESENAYRQGQLGLSQQQFGLAQSKEAREQQLQPFEMGKMKAETQKAQAEADQKKYINKLFQNAMTGKDIGKDASMDLIATIQGHPPTPSVHDGYQWIYNPLTGQMRKGEKVGETEEEKRKSEIEKTKSVEEIAASQKRADQYLASADIVNKYAPNIRTAYELLNKYKQSQNLTGNIAGARSVMNLSSEDQGKFKTATQPLIGELAREMAKQGGAVVSGLAQAGKPGIWESHVSNVGKTKELINKAIHDFYLAKSGYEESTGKKFPTKLDPFFADFPIRIKDSNGKEHTIAAGNFDDAKKRDKNVQMIGVG